MVIIGNAKVSLAEGIGNGQRNLGFRLNHLGAVLLHGREHLLLHRHCERPALFGFGARNAGVGLSLGGLKIRIGDRQIDATVRTRLDNLRTEIIARSSYEIQSRRDHFSTD